MSPTYVKDSGGNWSLIEKVYQKINGVWVPMKYIKTKVNGNWEIVYDYRIPEGAVMLMQDTNPSAASKWKLADGNNGTPNLTNGNRYVKIGSNVLSTGGYYYHTHTNSMSSSAVNNHAGNDQAWPKHAHMTTSSHYHSTTHTHTTTYSPSKVALRPFYGGEYIPANAVLIWINTSSPTFSQITELYTALTYYLLNLSGTYEEKHYSDHKDSYSGKSGWVNCNLVNTSRDYGSSSADYGQHRHTINHTHAAISAEKSLPPSRGLRLFKATADMFYVPSGVCFLYTKSGDTPLGYTDLTSTWGDRYMSLKSGSGNINNSMGYTNHTVPYTSFNTGYIVDQTRTHGLQENDRYVIPNHRHSFGHGHSGGGLNAPEYRNFRLIRKN
jgi:hypothetical protein